MKTKIFALALLALATVGCKNGGDDLSFNTTDTPDAFKYEAKYDGNKTAKLEKYLDSAFSNELRLDQNIDLTVNLNGKDKFDLKAKNGWLEINYDKRKGSLAGYQKLKEVTAGIGSKLTEK